MMVESPGPIRGPLQPYCSAKSIGWPVENQKLQRNSLGHGLTMGWGNGLKFADGLATVPHAMEWEHHQWPPRPLEPFRRGHQRLADHS